MGQFNSQPIIKATDNYEKTVSVYGYDSVTFDIAGTASSATILFYIIAGSGERRSVNPTRISGDLDIVQSAEMGNVYNFDTTGIASVVISISDVSDGYVNVFMTGVD